jgi:O-6-methylguanine DNA methyltransferase
MSSARARAIVEGLRTQRRRAPESLAGRVLAEVGLADSWTEVAGPIGPLYVAWGAKGISAVERAGDAAGFELTYALRTGRPVQRVGSMPERLARGVRRRLAGERTDGPAVDLGGLTEFERDVLRKTMEIPFGEVRPYAWVAREIGRPRAVRAVGSALARNPIAFVIPCHRVVRADGRIGEYGAGGPEAKRQVLGVEGVDAPELERLADEHVRYRGSRTTGIYCYPSCRHARRISPRHRVAFASADEAMAAGFRACRSCRPLESLVFMTSGREQRAPRRTRGGVRT